jgi:hypothetical protein
VDTLLKIELIASYRSVEEILRFVDADSPATCRCPRCAKNPY